MRSCLIAVIALLVGCCAAAQAQPSIDEFIRPAPVPARVVNDDASLLVEAERDDLSKELAAFWKSSANCIVIITLDSLTNPHTLKKYTLEETATAYFNKWGICDKEKNNGVLILIVPSRRVIRIEVDYGLESILTDEVCKQIITGEIAPRFKQGYYYSGSKAAIKIIKQKLGSSNSCIESSPVEGVAAAGLVMAGSLTKHQPIWGSFWYFSS